MTYISKDSIIKTNPIMVKIDELEEQMKYILDRLNKIEDRLVQEGVFVGYRNSASLWEKR